MLSDRDTEISLCSHSSQSRAANKTVTQCDTSYKISHCPTIHSFNQILPSIYQSAVPAIHPLCVTSIFAQPLNVGVPLRLDLSPLLSLTYPLAQGNFHHPPDFNFHPPRSPYLNSRSTLQKSLSSTEISQSTQTQHNQNFILLPNITTLPILPDNGTTIHTQKPV